MRTIIFDVDGCLADFVWGFTKEVIERGSFVDMAGYPQPWGTRENKSRWDFTDRFTKKEIEDAWSRVKGSKNWWTKLPALEDHETFAQIDELQYDHHVLFVTARVGWNPQWQTRVWLEDHGVLQPNVVVTEKKGEIASAVGASFHVDDKPENAACVHWMAKKCRSYFVEHDYRKGGDWLPERIKRIKSVKEYLNDIRSMENDLG
jgi:hypothetical protein